MTCTAFLPSLARRRMRAGRLLLLPGSVHPCSSSIYNGRSLSSSAAPPPAPRTGLLSRLLLLASGLVGGYALGTAYPPALYTLVYPRPAPPSPPADSEEGRAQTQVIEERLQALPIVKKLRAEKLDAPVGASADDQSSQSPTQAVAARGANPLTDPLSASSSVPAYKESRPYLRYPPSKLQHSLTAGSLRGPGKLAVPPLVFTKNGQPGKEGLTGESVLIIHAGRSLCGHDGIVHGGLLATLCDEALARTAFYNLPSNVGVTARLEMDYRAPTLADQFLVIRTYPVSTKGRKAIVRGTIEDESGKLLAEAKAIFVEPKHAKLLLSRNIREAYE